MFRELALGALVACPVAQQKAFTPVRPSVLGLTLERAGDSATFRVVKRAGEKLEILVRGDRKACVAAMIGLLEKKHGAGRLNLPMKTLGGRQAWADEMIFAGWRIQENVLTGHYRLLDPSDKRRAWGSWEGCRVALEKERLRLSLAPTSGELVLLVHGLGRSRKSFASMKGVLEKEGYAVFDVGYPSTRRGIDAHAAQLARVLDRAEGAREVSFVTHSLGGIVVRKLLSKKRDWQKRLRAKRVVMLGPPNRGSVIANKVKKNSAVRAVMGAPIAELTPEQVAKIPAPPIPFAVIAGGKGDSAGFNPLLAGDDDGVVTVEHTRLPGMAEFRRIHCTHSKLMRADEAVALVLRFLGTGSFERR